MDDRISSFAKGLRVIEAFSAERPRLSIAEASMATGLDRATARRCLLTLAAEGYAQHDGKFFTLTPRVLRLGMGCLAAMPLPRIVQPALDRLSEEIGESASISILDGAEIVYIARAARKRVMSIALMPGSRLPAACTSMGRVLLAALPPAEARALVLAAPPSQRTPLTETDPDRLMDRIAETGRQGFALIDQEVEMGLRSVAVPLFDTRGRVVAAMNVGLAVTAESAAEMAARLLLALRRVQEDLRHLIA